MGLHLLAEVDADFDLLKVSLEQNHTHPMLLVSANFCLDFFVG